MLKHAPISKGGVESNGLRQSRAMRAKWGNHWKRVLLKRTRNAALRPFLAEVPGAGDGFKSGSGQDEGKWGEE